MDVKILTYEQASSSNDIAKELAVKENSHGTVVVVNSQTSGRGRMGRSFISSSQNGLYMSIVLKPDKEVEKYSLLTAMSCVAVVNAIKECTGVDAQIKWVNDVYLNDKKICGILTESKLSANGYEYIICGIGVNVLTPHGGFDEEISSIAGALLDGPVDPEFKLTLCKAIVKEFFKYYDNIEAEEFMPLYREKSCIIGCDVDVYFGNDIIPATVIDIDNNAALVVKCQSGEIRRFNSGEARVRRSGQTL